MELESAGKFSAFELDGKEIDIISEHTPRFYGTYLKIALDDKLPEIDSETMKLLKNRQFTKYIMDNEDPVLSVKIMSYTMSHSILKPQRLLEDDDDYYVALDMYTNTYYICYRDLMMIDIDRYKNNEIDVLEDIKNKLSRYPDIFFRIYSSRNGYHVFVLNKSMDYKSDENIRLMYDLGCDFYYIVYSYLRGWSVRLNRKKGEENADFLYSWIGDMIKGCFFSSDITSGHYGIDIPSHDIKSQLSDSVIDLNGDIMPNDRLEKLVDYHIELTKHFKDSGISSMPAPK